MIFLNKKGKSKVRY